MKNPLWKKQPGLDRLICVLVASVALFVVQIVMSHITHSLTLLVAAYHMLYNIFSLIGCIATIKVFENLFLFGVRLNLFAHVTRTLPQTRCT